MRALRRPYALTAIATLTLLLLTMLARRSSHSGDLYLPDGSVNKELLLSLVKEVWQV